MLAAILSSGKPGDLAEALFRRPGVAGAEQAPPLFVAPAIWLKLQIDIHLKLRRANARAHLDAG